MLIMGVCVFVHRGVNRAWGRGTENPYTEHCYVQENQPIRLFPTSFLSKIILLTSGNNWLCDTKARY